MTRGYVIVKRGRKIKVAYRFPSDAYPCGSGDSYCGIVAAAFRSDNFLEHITNALEDEVEQGIGTTLEPELTRDWYVCTSKNDTQVFDDYAYEYDEAKDTLTIYYFGDKAFVFTREQIPYMDYLFGVGKDEGCRFYHRVLAGLCYDFNKLSFFGDVALCGKVFMSLMNGGATIDEIEATVARTLKTARIEVHGGRIIDHKPESFGKTVSLLDDDGDSKHDFTFIIDYTNFMPRNKQYSLLFQTPTCRRYVGRECGSATGAMKQLYTLLRDPSFVDRLEKTAEVFEKVENLQRRFGECLGKTKTAQRIGSNIIKEARTLASEADGLEPLVGGVTARDLFFEVVNSMDRRLIALSQKKAWLAR